MTPEDRAQAAEASLGRAHEAALALQTFLAPAVVKLWARSIIYDPAVPPEARKLVEMAVRRYAALLRDLLDAP